MNIADLHRKEILKNRNKLIFVIICKNDLPDELALLYLVALFDQHI